MGSCVTKPGCPPCDRFRGWGNEYKGDLCNLGETVVKTEDLENEKNWKTENEHHKYVGVTADPGVLAKESLHDVGAVVTDTVAKVKGWEQEVEDVLHIIIIAAEIIVFIILFVLFVYVTYRVGKACFACYKCIFIPMPKCCRTKGKEEQKKTEEKASTNV